MNTRPIYKALSILGDVKAASRGPGSYGRRVMRRSAHRELARLLRKVLPS